MHTCKECAASRENALQQESEHRHDPSEKTFIEVDDELNVGTQRDRPSSSLREVIASSCRFSKPRLPEREGEHLLFARGACPAVVRKITNGFTHWAPPVLPLCPVQIIHIRLFNF